MSFLSFQMKKKEISLAGVVLVIGSLLLKVDRLHEAMRVVFFICLVIFILDYLWTSETQMVTTKI